MADARTQQYGQSGETFLPATFVERGASVPFTAPQLAGSRVRLNREGKLESVLPSPGGRGVYVVPWQGVGSASRPTVYDMRLFERIGSLSAITPHAIRNISLSLAAEGLAGRPAMLAAQGALRSMADTRVRTHYWLLLRLIEDCEAGSGSPPSPPQDEPAKIEIRGRAVMKQLAVALGCRQDAIATALEDLAELFASLGVCPDLADAFVPRMLRRLRAMRDQLRKTEVGTDIFRADANLIADVLDVLVANARTAAQAALALPRRMGGLIRGWRADPGALQRIILRAEWLLDGWERIHALWRLQSADPACELPIHEIATLLPLVPPGEKAAADMHGTSQALLQGRRRKLVLPPE
jgi:hypothetical protein